MSISFEIDKIAIVHDQGMTVAEAARLLQAGNPVQLVNDFSESAPESIGIYIGNQMRIGSIPFDLALEIREITGDFEELNAEITDTQKTPGLTFAVKICLSDFSWDRSTGIPVLVLDTKNRNIKPAQGHYSYTIYRAQMELKRLKNEETKIRRMK